MSTMTTLRTSISRRWRYFLRHVRHDPHKYAGIFAGILAIIIVVASLGVWGVRTLNAPKGGGGGYDTSTASSSTEMKAVVPLNVGNPPGTTKGYKSMDTEETRQSVKVTTCVLSNGTITVKGTTANHRNKDAAYHHYVTLKTKGDWYRVQVNVKQVKAGATSPFTMNLDDTKADGTITGCAVASEIKEA